MAGSSNVLTAILAVFMSVVEWIVDVLGSLTDVFWTAEAGLSFIGYLSVAGLAFAVAFLLFSVIRGFLRFR